MSYRKGAAHSTKGRPHLVQLYLTTGINLEASSVPLERTIAHERGWMGVTASWRHLKEESRYMEGT